MTSTIGSGTLQNLPLQQWYPTLFVALTAYFSADVSVVLIRQYMLPKAVVTSSAGQTLTAQRVSRSVYSDITQRNIFNRDGVIPAELTAEGDESDVESIEEADPVPSQLPLGLLGTIVHGNPGRSVATVDLKGRNKVQPFQVGDDIEGMAEVTAIERRKVIFRNLKNNGRLEYIELKFDGKIRFGGGKTSASPIAPAPNASEVVNRGENKFEIKRDDVLKYTNDLPTLLQQARAVPNRDPQTGEVNGFRVLDIKADSIFSQLGIQRMDVIKSVNGEPVNSPKKAMELYQALRNENKIEIGIERNGRSETLDYNIK